MKLLAKVMSKFLIRVNEVVSFSDIKISVLKYIQICLKGQMY